MDPLPGLVMRNFMRNFLCWLLGHRIDDIQEVEGMPVHWCGRYNSRRQLKQAVSTRNYYDKEREDDKMSENKKSLKLEKIAGTGFYTVSDYTPPKAEDFSRESMRQITKALMTEIHRESGKASGHNTGDPCLEDL